MKDLVSDEGGKSRVDRTIREEMDHITELSAMLT
jgi:hypothetical protein